MTTKNTTMALAELAEKSADLDLLREMIQFVAQRLMDMDVETLCGAALGVALGRAATGQCRQRGAGEQDGAHDVGPAGP